MRVCALRREVTAIYSYPHIIASALLCALLIMIFGRGAQLARKGVNAFVRGPQYTAFGVYYVLFTYAVLAPSLGWPFPALLAAPLWSCAPLAWAGVLLCLLGVAGYALCIASFEESFRIGIDEKAPGGLKTGGIFKYSRNPLYISLLTLYAGLFLTFANPAMAVNLILSVIIILRQIFAEERFLRERHGAEYAEYCRKTGRFFGRR